jgi:hypothetical protein
VISIWGSDWDPSLGTSNKKTEDTATVHYLTQNISDDFSDVYGINAVGFHVLYTGIYKFVRTRRDNPLNPSTFSVSIYNDASVRIRYHDVHSSHEEPDVYGLWGSRAHSSNDTHGTRYNEEPIDVKYVNSSTDMIFCSIDTIACVSETAVHAGGVVTVGVLGDEPSCVALGEPLQMQCMWSGGSSKEFMTTPQFSSDGDSRTIMKCPVPAMAFADKSLVSLDIQFGANISTVQQSTMTDGQKSYYGKYRDTLTGEVSNTHLLLRYFSSEAAMSSSAYGCYALHNNASSDRLTCDVCMVCGGNGSTVDCFGECFGVAYIDSCGVCAGGSTGVYPDTSCDLTSGPNYPEANMLDTISKTILLLTMMICMTFIFSACMRVVRASFVNGNEHRHIDGGLMGMIPTHPLRRGNGLSRFEIDSLGEFRYSSGACEVVAAGVGAAGGAGGGTKLSSSDIESSVGSSGNSACTPAMIDFTAECAICLNDLTEGDSCRQLPCDHIFHTDCIDQWFTLSVACPMCKRNIRAIILGEGDAGSAQVPEYRNRPRAPSGGDAHAVFGASASAGAGGGGGGSGSGSGSGGEYSEMTSASAAPIAETSPSGSSRAVSNPMIELADLRARGNSGGSEGQLLHEDDSDG